MSKERNYWSIVFSGITWEKFLESGAETAGFTERLKTNLNQIKIGDYLICYVTGIQRFIGVLEVNSEIYKDNSPIWETRTFPCRFKVKLIKSLKPEHAIPIKSLKDQLSIFKNLKNKKRWNGFFRNSPNLCKGQDGEIIFKAIEEAWENPKLREFKKNSYFKPPIKYQSNIGQVTVPDSEPENNEETFMLSKINSKKELLEDDSHVKIQWLLLKLGVDMGLSVWVAKNDYNNEYEGNKFRDIKGLLNSLPRQFDEATNKTIELIDVLWLDGDAIKAAFEIEHTTSIYSGLLRMSDLVSMQPNIKINLYIVASENRRKKVFTEINRPTFSKLNPPLPKICKFISYTNLKQNINQYGAMAKHLKPDFIDEFAEEVDK